MKATVTTIGIKQTQRSFQRMAKDLGRTLPSLVTQAARSCAINYGYHSQPYGFAESAAESFRNTVNAEVARVYTTRENASGVYLLIRKVDPLKAEAFWQAHKKGSKRRALAILATVSIPTGTDISILKAARVGKNAHVPKKIQPRSLVTAPQLRAIQKRQENLVGFAKAGFYQAARALGRVRSTVTAADGTRTSQQIFPSYIRKLSNRYPGIGRGVVVSTENQAAATISSSVRHATNALPASRRKQAESAAEEGFQKACRDALAHIVRKRTA